MAPSPALQARLKELERERKSSLRGRGPSWSVEDEILGQLGRRLDAEERGDGGATPGAATPPPTVELSRVEPPATPAGAHEFTTFEAYAGRARTPPPDAAARPAFASPSARFREGIAADARFYAAMLDEDEGKEVSSPLARGRALEPEEEDAPPPREAVDPPAPAAAAVDTDDSDDDAALLAMHTAYQAAARRRPGARDQIWSPSKRSSQDPLGYARSGNPADVLTAALAPAPAAESSPAVPTPAGIAARVVASPPVDAPSPAGIAARIVASPPADPLPSPVADVGDAVARRRPVSEAWPVEAPVRAPRSPPPSPPVRTRRPDVPNASPARAASIHKVPPGAAISPPPATKAAPSPPPSPAPPPPPPPAPAAELVAEAALPFPASESQAASTKTATPKGHRVVTMSSGCSARAPPPAEPASPPPPVLDAVAPAPMDPRSPRPDRSPTFARAKRPAAAPAPAASAPPPPSPTSKDLVARIERSARQQAAASPPAPAASRPQRASKAVAVLVLLGYSLGVAMRRPPPTPPAETPVRLTSGPKAEQPVRLARRPEWERLGKEQAPAAAAGAPRWWRPKSALARVQSEATEALRHLRHRFRSPRRPPPGDL